jgi:tyrosyl-tRNA synthetase
LEGVEGITFFCTSETFIIAKKFFPLSSFVRLNSLEEILQQTNKPAAPRAMFAKIEDIVVSNNHCQAIEDSKAWLSSYHLELIEKLFKDDFKIEICDEANNVILTLERKKNGTES